MTKRILLIAPTFYNYHNLIKEALEKRGYSVDYFDIRPSTNTIVKGLIKLNRKMVQGLLEAYIKKIINMTSENHYDSLFFITCVAFDEKELDKFKQVFKTSKFILYLWDAIENYPDMIKLFKYFDEIFSFDLFDCENYSELNFLPLFFSKEYEKIGRIQKYDYDVLSICTAHPVRYPILKELQHYFYKNNLRHYFYMYLGSPLLYAYNKLKIPEFKNANYKEFCYKPLSGIEVLSLVQRSKVIFDLCNKNQVGLTIRSIEALGARKKLITNNPSIVNYDFYNPHNILLLEEKKEIDLDFFTQEYQEVSADVYKKYTLENWIEKIINKNEKVN